LSIGCDLGGGKRGEDVLRTARKGGKGEEALELITGAEEREGEGWSFLA